jgi:hypothetical protein
MNNRERMHRQLEELHHLVWAQRGLRLGLRTVWLGLTGIFLGWALHALWGWLPNPAAWFLIGLAFALVPAVPLFGLVLDSLRRSPPGASTSRWVWRLDRRLGFKEQISTAWGIVQKRENGRMNEALVRDVLGILSQVRRRVWKHGWFLERDLVSASIVLLLCGIMVTSLLLRPAADIPFDAPALDPFASAPLPQDQPPSDRPPAAPPPAGDEALPPETDPSAGDGQPGNAPQGGGQPEANPSGENGGGAALGSQSGSAPNTPVDPATAEALRRLGSELSEQAGTYGLGQALEQLDLDAAAGALEDLNDNLDDLSPESRENLAEAMQEAAEALENTGEQPLSDDLRDAADSLAGPGQQANEALDQVAGDLRQLSGEMGSAEMAGGGTGEGSGSAEPLPRLQGEGSDLELPLDDSSQSGLLSPAPQETGGDATASGSLDSAYQAGDDEAASPLLPNSYLWKWRDVVGKYFQR